MQGVGYRYFAQEAAEALGVTGWVRNNFDRTVELEAQADAQTLESYCERLRDGPTLAHVKHLTQSELPTVDDETTFEVRA